MRVSPPSTTRPDPTLPRLRPGGRATTLPGGSSVEAAGATHTGRKRKTNEDHFLIADVRREVHVRDTSIGGGAGREISKPSGTVMMVADGMGGHGHGDIASAVTLDTLAGHVATLVPWFATHGEREDAHTLAAFERSLEAARARLERVAERKGLADYHIGTTVTLAYVDAQVLLLAHVGDSRCYLFRDGGLYQLTTDHTLGAQLRQQGASDSMAGRFDNRLTNAIGGGVAKPTAELSRHALGAGDRLLLCSDGVTAHLDDEALTALLGAGADPRELSASIVSAAVDQGGTDNVTAVVATLM